MEFTAEDLPAINAVLGLSDYRDFNLLIQCVRAALKVGLTYPVQDASQLENFLGELNHDVAWFETLFAWSLPVQDQNDFIVKALLAAKQWLILEPTPPPKSWLRFGPVGAQPGEDR
jgi:hypothetical protein